MNSDPSEHVRRIAIEALSQPLERRSSYLKTACGGNDTMRAEIEALLARDSDQTAGTLPADSHQRLDTLLPGGGAKMIGPYRLLDVIGTGGMGVVYRAEQREPITRIVAVKVIKPGFDTREVIARFESERQTLARLDHPHIAHVYDAGTTDTGRPFFVMEYVSGKAITMFADENRLTIQERLQLFMQACDAIQHAHTKAIIHRDIKPSNVLAYMRDGIPTVKVIDFGIAKAMTAGPASDLTFATSLGGAVGTYAYMSPEQAAGSADIDIRTDVYSLGMVLYELLVGAKAFEQETFASAANAEIRRIIQDVEPPQPSKRLRSLGESATAVAAKRQIDVARLQRELKNELEWLPIMAIRKERQRRYASVSQLSEDIQNYFDGKPLRAGPDSIGYRVGKFVRRNKAVIVTTCGVFLILVLAVVVTTTEFIGERRARRSADEQTAIVQEQSRNLQEQNDKAIRETERADRELETERQRTYLAAIVGGRACIQDREFGSAQSWLDEAPPMERKWEWGYLKGKSDGSIAAPSVFDTPYCAISNDGLRIARWCYDLAGTSVNWWWEINDLSSGKVVATRKRAYGLSQNPDGPSDVELPIVFSRDHAQILSWCWNGAAHVYDAETGRIVAKLVASTQPSALLGAGFSPDGDRIVLSMYNDNSAYIFDAASGQRIRTLSGHKQQVDFVAFSPDGKLIVTTSEDNTCRLWDATSGSELAVLSKGNSLGGVEFSPDGAQIALGAMRGDTAGDTVVYDVAARKEMFRVQGPTASYPGSWYIFASYTASGSSGYSSDGTRLVTLWDDHTVHVWDARSGKQITVLTGHEQEVICAVFSPDGTKIVTVSRDGTGRVWDAGSGKQIALLCGPNPPRVARFSPDGSRIITMSDADIRIWKPDYTNGIVRVREGEEGVTNAVLTSDGKYAVTGAGDAKIRLWDLETGKMIFSQAHPSQQPAVVSKRGNRVLTIGDDSAKILDSATGEVVSTLNETGDGLSNAAFNNNGTQVVTVSTKHMAQIWDVNSGQQIASLTGEIATATFNSSGDRVISLPSNGRLARICDARSGKQITVLDGNQPVATFGVYSPDDTRIVTGSDDLTASLWDAGTQTQIAVLRGHKSDVKSATFSPHGEMFVTLGSDYEHTARLWDSVSGKELAVLRGHEDEVLSAIFSSDGTRIVTTSKDKTARVWDTATGKELVVLRGHDNAVDASAFSADGTKIITVSEDGTARTWDSISAADHFKATGQALIPSTQP